MLPYEFDYYRPVGIQEAVELFQTLDQQGKSPKFFSGGTELITLGRINLVHTEAVIDINDIPEFHIMQINENQLILGSALSLTKVEEAHLFPLLTQTASEVADHTARGKITLGGNICAQIYYREVVLPFLLAESRAMIAGSGGIRVEPIHKLFEQTLQLETGEILVQLTTDRRAVVAPFFHRKRRQQWETGYPLVTIAALSMNGEIRVAFSGLCPFPFRSPDMEAVLNNRHLPKKERIQEALQRIPEPVLDDVEGSAGFRIFVLENLLDDVLTALQR